MNRLSSSRQYLQELQNHPSNATLMSQLAFALFEERDHEAALQWFTKAVNTDPNVKNLTNLGWFLIEEYGVNQENSNLDYEERLSLAITYLNQARELDPNIENPFFALAVAYYYRDQPKEAEKFIRKAIAIKPNFFNHNLLSVILFEEGNIEEAKEWFYQAFLSKLAGNTVYEPYFWYGICLDRLGKQEEAQKVAYDLYQNEETRNWVAETPNSFIFKLGEEEEPTIALTCYFIDCPICQE